MNQAKGLRYIAAAKGDPRLAAWISVLDEHKLSLYADVGPDEWWTAYESLYLADAIEPNVFNATDIKDVFYTGNYIPDNRSIGDAMITLDYVKSLHPSEAIDNEELYMSNDKPLGLTLDTILTKREGHGLSLHRGDMGEVRGLAKREMPGELGSLLDSQPVLDRPGQDIQYGLPCHGETHSDLGKPATEEIDFKIFCCEKEMVVSFDDDGDVFPADAGEDYDTVDLSIHSMCQRCGAQYHTGVSKPVPKGSF